MTARLPLWSIATFFLSLRLLASGASTVPDSTENGFHTIALYFLVISWTASCAAMRLCAKSFLHVTSTPVVSYQFYAQFPVLIHHLFRKDYLCSDTLMHLPVFRCNDLLQGEQPFPLVIDNYYIIIFIYYIKRNIFRFNLRCFTFRYSDI